MHYYTSTGLLQPQSPQKVASHPPTDGMEEYFNQSLSLGERQEMTGRGHSKVPGHISGMAPHKHFIYTSILGCSSNILLTMIIKLSLAHRYSVTPQKSEKFPQTSLFCGALNCSGHIDVQISHVNEVVTE